MGAISVPKPGEILGIPDILGIPSISIISGISRISRIPIIFGKSKIPGVPDNPNILKSWS